MSGKINRIKKINKSTGPRHHCSGVDEHAVVIVIQDHTFMALQIHQYRSVTRANQIQALNVWHIFIGGSRSSRYLHLGTLPWPISDWNCIKWRRPTTIQGIVLLPSSCLCAFRPRHLCGWSGTPGKLLYLEPPRAPIIREIEPLDTADFPRQPQKKYPGPSSFPSIANILPIDTKSFVFRRVITTHLSCPQHIHPLS